MASATSDGATHSVSAIRLRNPFSLLSERAFGALLGAAVGDALGAPVEFLTASEVHARHGVLREMVGGGWLSLRPGQVTDDTDMTLCVARSLVTVGFSPADIAARFATWLRSHPVDVGATCRRGIRRYITHGTVKAPPNDGDAGNGAAMRMAPVALATLGDEARLERWAVEQARITHHHPLSDEACVLVGKLLHGACRGDPMTTLRETVRTAVAQTPAFRFDRYRGVCSAYVADTMKTVLYHLFETATFEECLVRTVNVGGDADTAGAIVGAIAGAYYGPSAIPARWVRRLDRPLEAELRELAPRLLAASHLGQALTSEQAPCLDFARSD